MPDSNEHAALELRVLRTELRVTSRSVAELMGVSDSWLSRRMNGFTELRVGDYARIKQAINAISQQKEFAGK